MNFTVLFFPRSLPTLFIRLIHFRVLQAHITFYQNCIQGLSLYEGSLADNKLLGKVCGNLNKNLPVFRSTTNKLSIALPRYFFTVDSPTNFTAAVIFSYGKVLKRSFYCKIETPI